MEAGLSWTVEALAPHAALLALVLPVVMRFVGHLLPEELFMIAIGIVAQRADTPGEATFLLMAVFVGHLIGDHTMFGVGVILERRAQRFPRLAARIRPMAQRLRARPSNLLGFIPGRVLPLARGAWMAACGWVGVPLALYSLVDAVAILVHIAFWSGLGWVFAGQIGSLELFAETAPLGAAWIAAALITAVVTIIALRRASPGWARQAELRLPRIG